MRTYKEEIQPAKTYQVVDDVRCDVCGELIPNRGMGEFDEVEIARKTGYSFPEGGNHTRVEVDMCPHCFREKLVPWLKGFGRFSPTEEEVDW